MVVWNNKNKKNLHVKAIPPSPVDKAVFPECSNYKLTVLTLSSMPTMYRVSLKAPISSWHFPYTMVMACRHIHFIWTLGVRRKRWYRSLKNSYLWILQTYMHIRMLTLQSSEVTWETNKHTAEYAVWFTYDFLIALVSSDSSSPSSNKSRR